MRKKENWMFKGAIVTVDGKAGVITKMQENTIDGTDYVYNIEVKLNGAKRSGVYHPNDIAELQVKEAEA